MASVNRKTRTATRSGRQSSSAKRRATSKHAGASRGRQAFVHCHYREEDFASGGLRRYAKYRDLGISKATHGMVRAHVIRFVPPFRPEEVSIRHYHDVDFQMVYVLKGWIKTELEGQGAITMRAGSSWIQPPRIKHSVLGYSDDCEVLEVILPADFETVMLDK